VLHWNPTSEAYKGVRASLGAPRRVPQCLLTTLVHILLFQSCYLWFTNNWESPYSLSILVQCFLKSEESWLRALDSNSHMAHFDGFVSKNISLYKCEHYSQYIYRWLLEILKQFKRSILNYRVIQKHIKNIVIFGGKQNIILIQYFDFGVGFLYNVEIGLQWHLRIPSSMHSIIFMNSTIFQQFMLDRANVLSWEPGWPYPARAALVISPTVLMMNPCLVDICCFWCFHFLVLAYRFLMPPPPLFSA